MDYLQIIREKAIVGYEWASRIFFGLSALGYVGCCVIAGELVGPVSYIGFLYHCCQWRVKSGG
jgi:hypothetical protein